MAERQLSQQRNDQRAQRRRDAEKNQRLRAEVEKLREEAAAARDARTTRGGEDEDERLDEDDCDEMDTTDDYAGMSEEERQKELELARSGLAYARNRHGENSPEADAIRSEIESIQRASREAKPFKAHRAQLERRRDRLRKQQDRDEAEIGKVNDSIAGLQEKLDKLRATVEERTKAIDKVEEELADLIKRTLADGTAAGSAGEATQVGQAPVWAQLRL